ncbi:hypothetical protein PIB30_037021 [Stylosanthes scabra]|uniref:non-specific serine/threonine protein kinase n=1 Tax=Stylosanthes scabra TaxID=79078 RepID=A0ABU6RDU7_9FABA|nr:hypothetical protein [Stylosanthes scabra]
MGFFSPGKSTSRYVGIWYNNLPQQTVIWVANRNTPINDTSGVLSINQHGNLALHHNHSILPIWSTNVSTTPSDTNKVIAQLTDIANLVLILNDTKAVIWQSFDQPTDTLIPHLRLGFDRGTNQSWVIQSWKTDDDPSPGDFTLKFSTSGMPQLFLYNKNRPWWRGGPWNGEFFMGIPNIKRDNNIFNVSCEEDENHAALSYNTYDKSVPSWVVVQQSGFFQVFTWDNQRNHWNRYWSEPTGQCDNYGTCGPNSNCDPLNYEDFQCTCLPGFEPKFPSNWYENRDGSGGCVRKKGVSVCGSGEGFVNIEGLKVPDTSVAIVKEGLSLEECERECLRKCSCSAYAVANLANGGSGCFSWHGDLLDIEKLSDQGQELFVRVDAVELANYYKKRKEAFGKKNIVGVLVASLFSVLLILACVYYLRLQKKKKKDKIQRSSLDWDKRFEIIYGIARGVLYLHQDSRLKIIHRDLKASNVLLDTAMNPKISDFGMARIFGEDQIQDRTRRVVGTYGYMSPEYAMEGRYSTKSDVFSFGVLLLEIIAGKRNTDGGDKERDSPNLIGYVSKEETGKQI